MKGWRFHNQHLILNFLKGLAVEISQPALEIFQGIYSQSCSYILLVVMLARRTYKIGGCDLSSTAPSCTRWIKMMAHIFSRAAWHCVWYMIQVD
ncbi:hypothetical protein AHAS_Ahas17G0194700 [Arachis hypogaea]